MNVDRAKFFLLAASMAGVCIVASAMPGCTTEAVDAASDAGPTVDTTDGAVVTADGGGVTPGACLGDDDGGVPDCAALSSATEGCLSSQYGLDTCNAAVFSLKTAVAREFIDCVAKLSTCSDEDQDAVLSCLDQANSKSCADTEVVGPCTEFASTCSAETAPIPPPVDAGASDAGASDASVADAGVGDPKPLDPLAICKQYASGLNTAGKANLGECLADTTLDTCTDPRSCTLFFAPVTE